MYVVGLSVETTKEGTVLIALTEVIYSRINYVMKTWMP